MDAPVIPNKSASYADIEALPPHLTGEILDGELHVQPRPSGVHGLAELGLGTDLTNPFQRGRGGPGGWWILTEPELHLAGQVLVPDLSGWRRTRLPRIPTDHRFTVAPDWVCEILSPGSARIDRVRKMRIHAQLEIPHCWLLDPIARTLEVYTRGPDGLWRLDSSHGDQERVRAAPFEAVELEMGLWWGEQEPSSV